MLECGWRMDSYSAASAPSRYPQALLCLPEVETASFVMLLMAPTNTFWFPASLTSTARIAITSPAWMMTASVLLVPERANAMMTIATNANAPNNNPGNPVGLELLTGAFVCCGGKVAVMLEYLPPLRH